MVAKQLISQREEVFLRLPLDEEAVKNKKSLLPSGVTAIEGQFEAGSVVMLNDSAKAVTSLDSTELETLAGKHSSEIRQILGPDRKDVIAIPEDIVFLDY